MASSTAGCVKRDLVMTCSITDPDATAFVSCSRAANEIGIPQPRLALSYAMLVNWIDVR